MLIKFHKPERTIRRCFGNSAGGALEHHHLVFTVSEVNEDAPEGLAAGEEPFGTLRRVVNTTHG